MELYIMLVSLWLCLTLQYSAVASIIISSKRREVSRVLNRIQRDDISDSVEDLLRLELLDHYKMESHSRRSRARRGLTREQNESPEEEINKKGRVRVPSNHSTEKQHQHDGRTVSESDLAELAQEFKEALAADPTLSYQKVGLDAHNVFRAQHGAKDLVANAELHEAAVKCAKYYLQLNKIDNSCPHKKVGSLGSAAVGENIWYVAGWRDPYPFVGQVAIRHWYAEGRKYRYFGQEPPPTKWLVGVGHFTQLVWKGSRQLGFGIAEREPRRKGMVVVALYHPAGNRWGEFKQNVKPAV